MKARLIRKSRDEFSNGLLIETVDWELPGTSSEGPHRLKYRLYCGKGGDCIVRYDNEAGKGDHRHYRDHEEPYQFLSFGRLAEYFLADVERLTGVRI